MRFTAILGTLDELDILPRTIDHLRSIGVDRTIILDHGSTDGTLDYIAREEAEGDIWLIRLPDTDGPDLHPTRSAIRAELARASEADYVLFLDSDELWLPANGRLADLADVGAADVIYVPRYNVVLGPRGPVLAGSLEPAAYPDTLVYALPIRDFYAHIRAHPETPWIQGVLEPKVMARPEAIEELQAGAHDVSGADDRRWRHRVAADMLIAHVPFRTHEAFLRRARNAEAAVRRSPDYFSRGQGWQLELWGASAANGTTRAEFERQRVDDDALEDLRSSGIVRSVRDVLADPIPTLEDDAAYARSVRRAEPWLTAAGLVCRIEALEPRQKFVHLSTGDIPTVLVPPGHVVRFYARHRDGLAIMAGEIEALHMRERDPDLPATRFVSSGRLDDVWRYVVLSRIEGTPLAEAREHGLRAGVLDGVVRWLGETLRSLHAVRLEDAERARGLRQFSALVERRRASVVSELARAGWSPGVNGESFEAWLPHASELIGGADELVFTHGDLHAGNVLGVHRPRAGRFAPTGIVGFSRAGLGHPLWDLGPIWWDIVRGDAALASVLVETAGLQDLVTGLTPRQLLAWAVLNPGPAGLPRPTSDAGAGDITDLDDLASRAFAGLTEPTPAH